MGWILSKFRRKKSTLEELEKIETELNSLGKLKTETLVWQKKVLGHLVTYSILAYLIAALVVYFRLLPSARDRKDQLVLFLPFLVTPLLIYILRRCLTWWYHRKVAKGDGKLATLREKKAKILDEVMEKETYKVAKQILDKFAPSRLVTPPRPIGQPSLRAVPGTAGTELRRRPGAAPTGAPQALNSSAPALTNAATPGLSSKPMGIMGEQRRGPAGAAPGVSGGVQGGAGAHPTGRGSGPPGPPAVLGPAGGRGGAPGPPLPRPVLPRERGYLDKFVEYLVGDGPANRFALICRQCQSHNGMALREEFEYVAYRCCYCYYWNPARKQRPVAPRLPDAATLPQSGAPSDTSDDDSDPPSRRNSLSKETIGVESESETNLVSGQHAKLDFVEKEQEILEEKVCGEDGGEPSETTPIIESSIEEESAAEAVVQSDIIEKAPGEPEEEKVEKKPSDIMQEDDVLGADWGLVVNPAEAVLKTSDDDGVLTPEEPMEVVEAEAVSFNSEEKEGNAAMGNEQ